MLAVFEIKKELSLIVNPWRAVLLLGVCLVRLAPCTARERKLQGQVFDREGLRQVRNFCVDTAHLESLDLDAVKTFLEKESRPHKLFARLPWKLAGDCAKADVVARIYFKQFNRARVGGNYGGSASSVSYEPVFQPVLLIYGPTFIQLIYRTEGPSIGKNREPLLAPTFANLLADLKTLGH